MKLDIIKPIRIKIKSDFYSFKEGDTPEIMDKDALDVLLTHKFAVPFQEGGEETLFKVEKELEDGGLDLGTLEDYTVKDLKSEIESAGLEVPANAKKSELVSILLDYINGDS